MYALVDLERAAAKAQAAGDIDSLTVLNEAIAAREKEIEQQYRDQRPAVREGSDAGFFENVATGFGSGAVGMAEIASLGAAALQEKEEEDKSREKIQRVAEYFRPEGGDKESITYGISSALGSVGAMATVPVVAAYVGAPALASTGIAALTGIAASRGTASERARAASATEEERNKAINSILVNASGALEALPMGRIFKSIDVPVLSKFLDKLSPEVAEGISGRVKNAVISGGLEGAQEASADIAQNLTEQEYNALAETFGGTAESFGYGSAAGAILDLFLGRRKRGGLEERDVNDAELGGTEVASDAEEEARLLRGTELGEQQIDMFSTELDAAESANRGRVGPTEEDIARETERRVEERNEVGAPEQLDMVSQAETEEINELEAAETAKADRSAFLDEQRKVLESELRQESELESVTGRIEGRTVSDRNARRETILQEVIEANPTTNYNLLRRKFKEALSSEGITNNVANEREVLTIQKAINFQKAERGSRLTKGVDQNTDTSGMESQIPARRTAAQTGDESGTTTTTDTERSRDSVAGRGAVVAGREAPEGTRDTVPTDDTRLGSSSDSSEDVRARERTERDALVIQDTTAKELAKLKGISVEAARKKITPKAPNAEAKTILADNNVVVGKDTPQVESVSKDASTLVKKLTGKKLPTTKATPKPKTDMQNKLEAIGFTPSSTARTGEVSSPTDTSTQIEYPTAIPRGTEFTNPDDVAAINTLLGKKIPRDEKGIEQTAQRYLKRFKRPADAFTAIAFEIAENTPKFQKRDNPTSEVAKFEGTGGDNTKATLQWIEKNLSPDAKAEIDKRVVEQQKESAKVEKDVTTRAKQEREDTKVKQRENKLAQDIDKVTAGKAKVVGTTAPSKATPKSEPSPTARADKAAKKKDIVKDATENVQGKAKTKPPLTEDMSPEQIRAKIKADIETAVAAGLKINVLNLELDPKVALALSSDLPKNVKALLKKGDLKGALQSLSKSSTNKRVKQAARALAENIGNTNIDMQSDLKSTTGRVVVSSFDPDTNTILFDTNTPLTVHALLHEGTHAVTADYLNNKSSDIRNQLNSLYESVKPYLGTAYGTESLNEFVAEAFSNPKFQKMLSRMNVKGEPISALQRFHRTVTNLMRRLIGMDTKPLGSALDAADGAIIAMLSPTIESQGTGATHMNSDREGVKKVLADIENTQRDISSKFSKNAWAKATYDFFNDMSIRNPYKIVKLKLSNSQILGDTARELGFGQLGIDLHKAIESQIGDIQLADVKIDKVINDAKSWTKKAGPKAYSTLNRVIYNSEYGATIYQVDPTLTLSQAKDKYGNMPSIDPSRTKFEVWKQNQKEWNKLKDNGGQHVFNQQRAQYKKMYTELLKTINGQIDDLVGKDSDASIKLKKEVFARMFEAGDLEVYFPLVRQGNFKISFDAKIRDASGNVTSTEPVFLMYEHKSDRDQAISDLENDPDVVGKISSFEGEPSVDRFENAPSGSFVANVLDVLKVNGVKPDVSDQVMRLFIDSLPQTSFAQSLQRRTNTLGYISDATLAMQLKGYSLSAQIERMKNGVRIRNIEKQIKDTEVPKGANSEVFKLTKGELLKRGKFARQGAKNKDAETYFKLFNQVAFIYTIGFNPSSALVNLSQIPLVVGPFLSGKFGTDQTFSAILEASRLVGGSSNSIVNYYTATGEGRGTTYAVSEAHKKKIRASTSDKAEADKEIKKLEDLAPLIKLAKQQGMLQTTALSEVLNVSDAGRTKNSNPAIRLLDNISALSAIGFTTAERFNRQATMIMSYTLVLNKMKDRKVAGKQYYSDVQGKFIDLPNGSKAIKELAASESMYLTQELNGGAVLETAPGWAQEGIGRVALMYKNYGLTMYYAMFKSMRMAWRNKSAIYNGDAQSKELLNTALQQAFGVHLSALFFAGVQGIPIYGAASMLADLFLDDEQDDADTIVRKHVGEGWYKGAVTKFTGADVASRVALTGLLLQDNRFNKDPSLEESIGKYVGGPFLSVLNRAYRGIKETAEAETSREYLRATESLIPAGIANVIKAAGRYSEEGIGTRRGDFIYGDITGGEIFAQALGFPPEEYTFRQEQNARNKGIEAAIGERRSKLTTKYYVAIRRGDYGRAVELLEDMQEFNKRHPNFVVDNETIKRSLKSHMATTATMNNGVTVNPALRAAVEQSNREYRR